jgi:hypothetical protein
MNPHDHTDLERLIRNSVSGIERKIIIERLGGQITKDGDDLIQIDKDCQCDDNGVIQESNIFNIRFYACGCRADGRKNFGGVDYLGHVVCSKHFYRCIRCRRPLSIRTVKPLDGICYCAKCRRIVKLLRFLGLKK